MINIVSFVTARIAELLHKASVDATAQRRRNQYKDKFWTTVELLEDRTLLSGTAPQVELVSHMPPTEGGSPGANAGGSGASNLGDGGGRQVSADGRFVTFFSEANDLVAGDSNPGADVFVLDRTDGSLERISVRWDNGMQTGESNGYSSTPSISADGRYVAFQSSASNLVDGDTNNAIDIFLYDRQLHVMERVSVSSSGAQAEAGSGNGDSVSPHISADGRVVAFVSSAVNLAAGDTGGWSQVYVRDLRDPQNPLTLRVSVDNDGHAADLDSFRPSLSADGNFVAFDSGATNLSDADDNAADVFLRDIRNGRTILVSGGLDGFDDTHGFNASVSGDGRYVAFHSGSSHIAPGDADGGAYDVFRFDRDLGTSILVSDPGGVDGAYNASISDDGRLVAFQSVNSNQILIYRRDLHSGDTQLVSQSVQGTGLNGVAFNPSLNSTGEFVAFNSNASNLVPDFTGSPNQVYLAFLPPPNTPPVVTQGEATVNEGEALRITTTMLHSADAEQAAGMLVYTLAGTPSNGVLQRDRGDGVLVTLNETDPTFTQAEIDAGLIWFLHDGGETTEGSFSFTVSDGIATTDAATLHIAVTPVNDAPALATTAAVGPEFTVGNVESTWQDRPAVGMNSVGDTVIAWQAYDAEAGAYDVYAQRFDAAGDPVGAAFRVNTFVAGDQARPAVAVHENGDFVIVWQSGRQDDDGSMGVYGQRFLANGTPVGEEFRVNTTTANSQQDPRVAIGANGDFIVVWHSNLQDDPENQNGVQFGGFGVYAQRYNAAGVPQGSEFQVNTYTLGNQQNPSVAADATGNFVIVWASEDDGRSGSTVWLQRYDALGNAIGGEQQVNSAAGRQGRGPAVAMSPDGDFVVTWASYAAQDGQFDIAAQRFDADGEEVGSEFRVNSFTTGYQVGPTIALSPDGEFIIAWTSQSQDGDGEGIFAQRFNAAGDPVGAEFLVNSLTSGHQYTPSIAIDAAGDVVVSWATGDQTFDVAARRYEGPHNQLTVREGQTRTISPAQLQTLDADNSPSTLTYTVTALPLYGDLLLNNVHLQDLPVPLTFTQADINEGRLSYAHLGDEESLADSFRFTVSDGFGGTVEESEFTITVLAVNDAPSAADGLAFRLQDVPGLIDLARQPDGTPLLSDSETDQLGHFTFEVIGVTHGSYTVDDEISDNGQFIAFTPDAGHLGDAVLRVRATDTGDRGTPPRSIEYDYVIHVTAPIARDDQIETDEDTPVLSFDVRSNDDVYGQAPSNNVILYSTEGTRGTPVVNADGTITFTPEANFNGTTSFQYQLVNASGETRTASVTVVVRSVNDAPSGADGTVTTREDTPHIFSVSDFGFSDGDDSPANGLLAVTIVSAPTTGSLTLNGVPVIDGQTILATDIASGSLVFTPAAHANGDDYARLTFRVQDDGDTLNGGIDVESAFHTITLNVTSVNDAPAGRDAAITTSEDTPIVFTVGDFGFSDVNDSPANALRSVAISSLPAAGTLTLDGELVSVGDSISVADIESGLLVFRPALHHPALDASGLSYASFTFQVRDNGGTDHDGIDLDPVPRQIIINVVPIADTPTLGVTDASGVEDEDGVGATIPLDVRIATPDLDESEVLSLVIGGVPLGVTLTDGENTFTGDLENGGTTGNLAGWNLRNLSAIVPEHYAFDFTLSLKVTSTESANTGSFAETEGSLTVSIAAVADAPTLAVHDVTRNEDTPIPLHVSSALVDTDGSESLSVFVRGLPEDVVISDGTGLPGRTMPSSGPEAWIDITGWDLSGLTLTLVEHSDEDFTLTFRSVATETENTGTPATQSAVTERSLVVTVVAVADAPLLAVSSAAGDEDTAIPLQGVSTGLVDDDGSERLALVVSGIPAGAVLTDGTNTNEGQSSVDVTLWDLANLTITPPLHSGDDFTLTFTSTTTEQNEIVPTAQTVRHAVVTVRAVADAPTLTVSSPGGDEDQPLPLVISSALVDADTSESLRVVISGIPSGARVTDGRNESIAGASSVDITGWDLGNLTITPPLNFNGTITLTVTATTTEGERWAGQDVATTVLPLEVVVLPVNDAPDVAPTPMPTIDQAQSYVVDLRPFLSDVETDRDDFTFEITQVTGGHATISNDGYFAIFVPDPDFVGIATFTYEATDTGDLPGPNPHSGAITRSGTISVRVLRYQDLGDAPDTYGTIAPDQENPSPNGARHGGSHLDPNPIRLGSTVGYGEPNGQPSVGADGDDQEVNGDDDEDGVTLLTGLGGRDDGGEVIATLRIEAPAGGRLDAWIDFDRDGTFDENERVVFRNNRRVTVVNGEPLTESTFQLDTEVDENGNPISSLVLHEGVNFVDVVIPEGAVNFQGTVVGQETTGPLDAVSTYARFRVSTLGHLDAQGFAFDGEVEDYQVTISRRTQSQTYDAALEVATERFIAAYADELIANENYDPNDPAQAVPLVFQGSGSGESEDEGSIGAQFERGETDQALQDIVAAINSEMRDRHPTENVFVFVTHPVDFVITDPQGRTFGHVNGETFNNIGDSVSYSGDGAVELLVIRNASPGEYQIDFTGVGGVFRGGASLITANGVQQSTFQGGLSVSQAVSLSLDYAAPVLGTEGSQVAQLGGRGQVFFNVADGNGAGDDEDALAALSGLDAENESGELTPREQIIRWIDAVRTNSKALKRVVLDELEPDWLTEDSLETQNLLDEFWTGLGQSMLGGIPGQVFQLGEFLGVEVPLLFAPAEPDGAPQEARSSGDATETQETSSVEGRRTTIATSTGLAGEGDDAGLGEVDGAGAVAVADAAGDESAVALRAVFDGSPDPRRLAVDAIRMLARGRRSLSGK